MATITTFPLASIVRTFGDQTVAGVKTYTDPAIFSASGATQGSASINLSSVTPRLRFLETDLSTDSKSWDILVSGGVMSFRFINDLDTLATTWLSISRTGYISPVLTFSGTIALPSTTSIGNVSATELSYLDGVTSSIQTQIGGRQPFMRL